MKEMVFEVVVGVVILSLLIGVIGLFRNNMSVIAHSAKNMSDLEKVAADSLIPLEKAECYGTDVVAVIRYYSNNPDVEVEVNIKGHGSKSYVTETFDLSEWSVPAFYEKKFDVNYAYDGDKQKIKKIVYTID